MIKHLIYHTCLIFVLASICFLPSLPIEAATNSVLAEIGSESVTLEELKLKISRIQEETFEAQLEIDTSALLIEMVQVEVLSKEASAIGLDQVDEIEDRIREYKDRILAETGLEAEDPEMASRLKVFEKYTLAMSYFQQEVG